MDDTQPIKSVGQGVCSAESQERAFSLPFPRPLGCGAAPGSGKVSPDQPRSPQGAVREKGTREISPYRHGRAARRPQIKPGTRRKEQRGTKRVSERGNG